MTPAKPFRPREISVLNACYKAHERVDGGNYLTSGRQETAAAKRLIDRGMLTLAKEQMPMLRNSIVVYLTQENWDAVRDASKEVQP
jgi:hypothetical protein